MVLIIDRGYLGCRLMKLEYWFIKSAQIFKIVKLGAKNCPYPTFSFCEAVECSEQSGVDTSVNEFDEMLTQN